MVKVAITTVNYNGLSDTLELLESLRKLDTKGLETEIIVVDNGSVDLQAEQIKEKFPKITVVKNPENTGSAGGFNSCIKKGLEIGADYVLLLNNDILINDKELLKKLLEVISQNPAIGAVSPKVLFAPGFEFHKDRYAKSEIGHVLWYAGGSFDWNNCFSKHRGIDEVDKGQFDQTEEVEFLNAACILMRKEIFAKNVWFDESFFAYFDDNDFNQKLNLAGFKKVYVGSTSCFHKVSRTAGIASPISDYYLTRNRLIFGFRYTSLRTKFALLRESVRFMISGRPAQKRGVVDFFLGRNGKRT